MSSILEKTERCVVYALNDPHDRKELFERVANCPRELIGATVETYSFDGSHPSHLWQSSHYARYFVTQVAYYPKLGEADARVELHLNGERRPSVKLFAGLLYGSATIPAQSGEVVRVELYVKIS